MDGFDPNDESPLQGDFNGNKSIYTQLVESGILDALELVQRDLVILNFPKSRRLRAGGGQTADDVDGGTDFVERNAYVLETLLNDLKPRIYTNPAGQRDKYAVIGPSMGGLISRFALAHMEQQQQLLADASQPADPWWDHNTATWLSFDVPHLGANIPLSDQYLLAFFKDTQSARDNLEQRLDAVAAKQFLVAHHTYAGAGVGGAPGFRDRFMLALRDNGERGSYGYPVHLRRVALADGKLNGQLPPSGDGTPCGTMLDVNVRTRTGGAVVNTILGFFGFSYGTTNPNLIATSTLRFLPNPNSNCQVFYGQTNQTSGLRWGRVGPTATQSTYLTGGSQGSWDLAPGGTRPTQQQLHDQFEAAGRGEPFRVEVTNVHPNHCFIPTVSALGFQYQSTSTYQNTGSLPNPFTNLLPRDMVCNNEIPFDDFYAPPTTNSGHVTVPNATAQAFLIRELTPRVATPILLSAPNELCGGGLLRTFAVKDCPPPGSNRPATAYTWTVTQGAHFANGLLTATGATVMIGGDANTDTDVTVAVVATRAGFAPSAPAVVTVEVIASVNSLFYLYSPSPDVNSSGTNVVCHDEFLRYSVGAYNYDASTIRWYTGEAGSEVLTHGYQGVVFDGNISIAIHALHNARYFSVYATAINLCTGLLETADRSASNFNSQSPAGGLVVQISNNCSPARSAPTGAAPGKHLSIYPNPANGQLQVRLESGEPLTGVGLRLYNGQGRLVREQTAAGAFCTFATADLPPGMYYLVAATPTGQVLRQHLEIKH